MIIVNNIKNQLITGMLSGVPFSLSYDKTKFEAMKELEQKALAVTTMNELKLIIDEFTPLMKESYKELVETACPDIVVNKSTNKFYLKLGAVVSSVPMPTPFADKIIKSVDSGVDATPLVKFWIRLLRNPKTTPGKLQRITDYIMAPYTDHEVVAKLMKEHGVSKEVAIERATTTQVAITQEGLIVGYKVSKEILHRYELDENQQPVKKHRYTPIIDEFTGVLTYKEPEYVEDRVFEPAAVRDKYDAFKCGDKLGHVIRVGQVHSLESWDQVNCHDDVSCVPGLHVGKLKSAA